MVMAACALERVPDEKLICNK